MLGNTRVTTAMFVAVAVCLVLLAAPAFAAWDISSDFSTTTNPKDAWSYGCLDGSGTFSLYTSVDGGDIDGAVSYGWRLAPDWGSQYGSVSYNSSSTIPIERWTSYREPLQVIPDNMAANKDNKSTARWTCPNGSDGTYAVITRFTGQSTDSSKGATTGVYVIINGQVAFSGNISGFIGRSVSDFSDGFGPARDICFDKIVTVKSGDTIDFAVDNGGDGNSNDCTGLAASIKELSGLGQLTGVVTDVADGKPVAGVSVTIDAGSGVVYHLLTGADGSYLKVLDAGSYAVTLTKDGYISQTSTQTIAAGTPVTYNVKLAKNSSFGQLTGVVTDAANGSPMSGVSIVISDGSGNTSKLVTGSDGSYVTLLNAGSYTVTMSKDGYVPHTSTQTLTAGMSVTYNVALALKKFWDVSADFSTSANPAGPWSYGCLDGSGNFTEYTAADGGDVDGAVSYGWHLPPDWGSQYGSVSYNSSDTIPIDHWTSYREPLQVTPDNMAADQSMKATSRWTCPVGCDGTYAVMTRFTGQSTDASKGATTGVYVIVNGQVAFSGNISGFIGRSVNDFSDGYGPARDICFDKIVTVTAGDTIDFSIDNGGDGNSNDCTGVAAGIKELTELGQLTGVITDAADGKPIAGASVAIDAGSGVVYNLLTGADGSYLKVLDPGSYTVTVSKEGYVSQTSTKTVTTGTPVTYSAALQRDSAYGELSGIVTDVASGDPIEGASVYIDNGSGSTYELLTGADGSYSKFLGVGSYTVTVSKGGYIAQTSTQDVTAQGSTIYNVALDKQTTWDAAADYSTENNPNGAWAYGYIDGTGAFGKYTLTEYSMVGDAASYIWHLPNDWNGHGGISFNASSITPIDHWTSYREPRQIVPDNMPSDQSIKTSVRWTCPEGSDGTYAVIANFTGQSTDSSKGATTGVYVIVNGQVDSSGALSGFIGRSANGFSDGFGSSRQVYISKVMNLKAGDVIDFAVDNGGDGVGNDTTGVDARITLTSQIAQLSGVVTDSVTKNAVVGALVTIDNGSGYSFRLKTDANGAYALLLENPGSSEYTITATKPGYTSQSATAVLAVGSPLVKDFALAARTAAATFYVSDSGSDKNDGTTPETAWASIDNGDKLYVLMPGDTVIVNGYFSAPVNLSTCGGTSSAPITYRAGSNGASIACDYQSTDFSVTGSSVSYIVIDGFDVSGGRYGFSFSSGASNVTLKNCYIHDINTDSRSTSSGAAILDQNCTGNLIVNNVCYSVGDPSWSETPQQSCINVDGSTNTGIYNNTLDSATNALCVNNVQNAEFMNNICVNMRGCNGADAVMHSNSGTASLTHSNNLFFNNIGYDGSNIDYDGTIAAGYMEFDTNPMFDTSQSGAFAYKLASGSPAINMGVGVGLPYTQPAPDLGAFESDSTDVSGFVTGTAYDGGRPTVGVVVTSSDGQARAVTDSNGKYTMPLYEGTYDLSATYGDASVQATGIVINVNKSVVHDFVFNPPATSWDLSADFSWTKNPNGDWSYGYLDGSGTLTPYTAADGGDVDGAVSYGWHLPPDWGSTYGSMSYNSSSTIPIDRWTSYREPLQVTPDNMAADRNIKATARWKCPYGAEGTYVVSARFTGQSTDPNKGATTTAYVIINGQVAFSGNISGFIGRSVNSFSDGYGSSKEVSFSKMITVKAGDIIDFAVDNGGDGNSNDTTGVSATIQSPGNVAQLSGVITDVVSGSPISGASVVVDGGSGNVYNLVTDTQGGYSVIVSPGSYTVAASMAGYDSVKSNSISVKAGEQVVQNLALNGVAAVNISGLKAIADGATVKLDGSFAATAGTASYADKSFYIEDLNRSSGIKVVPADDTLTINIGDRACLVGKLCTDSTSGERYISAVSITNRVNGNAISPLGMNNKSACVPITSGLLVRIWGKVTYADPNGAFVYVDDGSGLSDGTSSNYTGIRVILAGVNDPAKYAILAQGYNVTVTGIVGSIKNGSSIIPVIRIRGGKDISNSAIKSWDAAADYSTENNPNGAWAYGCIDGTGAFTQYTLTEFSTVGDAASYIWHLPNDWNGHGGISFNASSSTPIDHWTSYREPRQITPDNLPSDQSIKTSVRWTCPAGFDGTYAVIANFTGQSTDSSKGTTTGVYVIVNGQVDSSGVLAGFIGRSVNGFADGFGSSRQVYLSKVMNLKAGDVIDFAIDNGGDGVGNDTTGVDAKVQLLSASATN